MGQLNVRQLYALLDQAGVQHPVVQLSGTYTFVRRQRGCRTGRLPDLLSKMTPLTAFPSMIGSVPHEWRNRSAPASVTMSLSSSLKISGSTTAVYRTHYDMGPLILFNRSVLIRLSGSWLVLRRWRWTPRDWTNHSLHGTVAQPVCLPGLNNPSQTLPVS